MDDTQFRILNEKLDILVSLHSHSLIKDKKVQEQVQILSSVGLKTKHIAKILGKTENNIKQVQHQIRLKNKAGSSRE